MFFHLELMPSSGHCHSLMTCGGDSSSLLSCAKRTSTISLKRSLHRLEIPAPIEMKSPIPTAQHHFQFNSVPCALSLKAIKCVPPYTQPSYYALSRPVKSMLVKRFFLCWLQSDLLLQINVAMGFQFFFQGQIS